jgi:hypothetical protein
MKLKVLLLFITIIICCSSAEASKFFIQDNSKYINSELVDAVKDILEEVYAKHHTNVNFITAVKSDAEYKLNDLKNALLQKPFFKKNPYMVRIEHYAFLEPVSENVKTNIVALIDSLESFMKLNERLTIDRFNFRGRYLFVFVNGYVGVKDGQKILSIMWKKGFFNVNFLYEDGNSIRMTTFKPFQNDSCNNLDERPVGSLKNGLFSIGNADEVFPKKFNNLHKCPVNVVTFERCPAMCYSKRHNTFSGYDYEILRELSNQINFEVNLNYIEGQQRWGTILPNGTVTWALGKLVNKEADIGIGNYFLRESRTKILDPSVNYFSIPIVLVIPPGECCFKVP